MASLPFPDASFDVVVCQQRLQRFPDRSRFLSEMHRVLVPGGRVAVEFLRRYVPGSPFGPATTHMSENDKRKVIADLETDLAGWVGSHGLTITMEANTGVARC